MSTQWREDGYEQYQTHGQGSRWLVARNSRLSLQFYAADITSEEGAALTEEFLPRLEWANKWVTIASRRSGIMYEYAFDTRREFSGLLPLMVRRFAAFGYDGETRQNYGHDTTVSLDGSGRIFGARLRSRKCFSRRLIRFTATNLRVARRKTSGAGWRIGRIQCDNP